MLHILLLVVNGVLQSLMAIKFILINVYMCVYMYLFLESQSIALTSTPLLIGACSGPVIRQTCTGVPVFPFQAI